MIPFGIQFSNDDGATWSTAFTATASNLRVTETNEAENLDNSLTGRRYPRKFTYLFVLLKIDWKYFDPSDTVYGATADASWAIIENVCSGLLVRLYNNDTTNFPNWDGHTELNLSNNTNYLLLESQTPQFEDMDGNGATGRKLRTMVLELQSRDSI